MCRKRVTDTWNKLTVGDVHRTLCKQKQTSALCATNSERKTSKRLFGLHFTANRVRTLRNNQLNIGQDLWRMQNICLSRKLKLTTDGQIFAFLTYFEKLSRRSQSFARNIFRRNL